MSISWNKTEKETPPEKELLLIYTENEEGDSGGIYLGGISNGIWYWLKGIEEIKIENYRVTWWVLVNYPGDKE